MLGACYIGWNKPVINAGNWFYGFSHIPYHQLELPANTYRITVFRDPVERIISHYRMVKGFKEKGIAHPRMKVEGKWLGDSFDDFFLICQMNI